ncbi:MAG TPA: serine hydrolase [Candidatus Omnitrophota bacterium]|nr:serine hydrolase [Candidatus Omnitrophota bacterium]
MRSRKICIALLAHFILAAVFPGISAMAGKPQVTCQSVIFSDSTKVKRLYGKRVHDRVLPASTAKVMTALIVLEQLGLDSYVTVSSNATKAQPTKLNLVPGEQYKVRDLLYAILIKSANDASIVLAEAVAGSHWKFVQMMNARAKRLGAKNTKFANSNGLPSKASQYTTAYDMYLIFRQALKNKFFREAIKFKYKTIYSKSGREIGLKSHNKILFKDWRQKIYGKTGYTRSAKSCFVGTLQKGGSTLIIGVFGCTNRWEDIKSIVSYYGGIAL